MNAFEAKFYNKYVPQGQSIEEIVHAHPISILHKIFLWLFLAVFLPVFFYYVSFSFKEMVPFLYFEIYLWIVFLKIIYDIFDWYNDVWIVTNHWVIDLDRTLFRSKMQTIYYDDIEWMEVDQNGIIDKIMRKWDLIIHKIWEETFGLPDCYHPYKYLNVIEDQRNNLLEWPEIEEHDTKFDIIMDSLWWVVEEYLSRNMDIHNEEEQKVQEHISKFENSKNSIDLR